ncbi:hypothetical protein ACFTZI_03720 [Streptomyces decoyicus]
MALASLEIDGAVEPLRRAHLTCLELAPHPTGPSLRGPWWANVEARGPL